MSFLLRQGCPLAAQPLPHALIGCASVTTCVTIPPYFADPAAQMGSQVQSVPLHS
jgi:hypothetical protein